MMISEIAFRNDYFQYMLFISLYGCVTSNNESIEKADTVEAEQKLEEENENEQTPKTINEKTSAIESKTDNVEPVEILDIECEEENVQPESTPISSIAKLMEG